MNGPYTTHQRDRMATLPTRPHPMPDKWRLLREQYSHWSTFDLIAKRYVCVFCGDVYCQPVSHSTGYDLVPGTCGPLCSQSMREGLKPAVLA